MWDCLIWIWFAFGLSMLSYVVMNLNFVLFIFLLHPLFSLRFVIKMLFSKIYIKFYLYLPRWHKWHRFWRLGSSVWWLMAESSGTSKICILVLSLFLGREPQIDFTSPAVLLTNVNWEQLGLAYLTEPAAPNWSNGEITWTQQKIFHIFFIFQCNGRPEFQIRLFLTNTTREWIELGAW